MRKLLAAAVLTSPRSPWPHPPPPAAGRWRSLDPLVAAPVAGEPFDVGFTILQHGETPVTVAGRGDRRDRRRRRPRPASPPRPRARSGTTWRRSRCRPPARSSGPIDRASACTTSGRCRSDRAARRRRRVATTDRRGRCRCSWSPPSLAGLGLLDLGRGRRMRAAPRRRDRPPAGAARRRGAGRRRRAARRCATTAATPHRRRPRSTAPTLFQAKGCATCHDGPDGTHRHRHRAVARRRRVVGRHADRRRGGRGLRGAVDRQPAVVHLARRQSARSIDADAGRGARRGRRPRRLPARRPTG